MSLVGLFMSDCAVMTDEAYSENKFITLPLLSVVWCRNCLSDSVAGLLLLVSESWHREGPGK